MSQKEGTTEREPAWILQQRKTFKAWCNSFLNKREFHISTLDGGDLESGVLLCNLLELLSSKEVMGKKFQKEPKMKLQKIQNLNVALKFIADEKLKLVGVGPEDLYDGKTKLILGLIWTLILRFQIQKGDFEDGKKPVSSAQSTVKRQLLNWCSDTLETQGLTVSNFQGAWQDGLAFCGLVNALAPGKIDLPSLSKKGDRENLELAFSQAHTLFGIPRLLDAEDLTTYTPDELSIMTYVSYFRQYSNEKKKKEERGESTIENKEKNSEEENTVESISKVDIMVEERLERISVENEEEGTDFDLVEGKEKKREVIIVRTYEESGVKSDSGGHHVEAFMRVPYAVSDNNDGTYCVSLDNGSILGERGGSIGKEGEDGLCMEVWVDGRRMTRTGMKVPSHLFLQQHNLQQMNKEREALSRAQQQMEEERETIAKEREALSKVKKNLQQQIDKESTRSQQAQREVEALKREVRQQVESHNSLLEDKDDMEQRMKQVLEEVEEERISKEKVNLELQRMQQQMKEMEEKVEEERTSKEKMNLELQRMQQQVEVLKSEVKEKDQSAVKHEHETQYYHGIKGRLESKISLLSTKLNERKDALALEESARKEMEEKASLLNYQLDDIKSKYQEKQDLLEEFKASQHDYHETLRDLQEKMKREEEAKRELERMQEELRTELGTQVMLGEEVARQMKEEKKKLALHILKKKKKDKKTRELENKVKELENSLEEEKTTRNAIHDTQQQLYLELSKRRESRVYLQEELESLRFRVQMDEEELDDEQKRRKELEKELEELHLTMIKEGTTPNERKRMQERTNRMQSELQTMNTEYKNALSSLSHIKSELEDTRLERDGLTSLQSKLKGELRARAMSRANIQVEMDNLRNQLTLNQVKEEHALQSQRNLKKKLDKEVKARVELEQLAEILEAELEVERLSMIPSSALDELEHAFIQTKDALELQISDKQNAVDAALDQARKEKEKRIVIEKQLKALQLSMKREVESKPPIHNRSRRPTTTTRPSTWDTSTTTPSSSSSSSSSRTTSTTTKNKIHSHKKGELSSLRKTCGTVTKGTKTGTTSQSKYKPRKGDIVDEKVASVLIDLPYDLPFTYIKPGIYEIGTKRAALRVLNGYLVIRVGGGYMKFNEWIDRYGKKENIKVEQRAMQHGRAQVGVHLRRGGAFKTKGL